MLYLSTVIQTVSTHLWSIWSSLTSCPSNNSTRQAPICVRQTEKDSNRSNCSHQQGRRKPLKLQSMLIININALMLHPEIEPGKLANKKHLQKKGKNSEERHGGGSSLQGQTREKERDNNAISSTHRL